MHTFKIYFVAILILFHIDPLLGNDHEANEIMAIDRQQALCNNRNTVGTGVFYVVPCEAVALN